MGLGPNTENHAGSDRRINWGNLVRDARDFVLYEAGSGTLLVGAAKITDTIANRYGHDVEDEMIWIAGAAGLVAGLAAWFDTATWRPIRGGNNPDR